MTKCVASGSINRGSVGSVNQTLLTKELLSLMIPGTR
jgi:hypothetical protein